MYINRFFYLLEIFFLVEKYKLLDFWYECFCLRRRIWGENFILFFYNIMELEKIR